MSPTLCQAELLRYVLGLPIPCTIRGARKKNTAILDRAFPLGGKSRIR